MGPTPRQPWGQRAEMRRLRTHSTCGERHRAPSRVDPDDRGPPADPEGIGMRETFHTTLDQISAILAQMAVKAGTAMNTATRALLDEDPGAAQEVIAGDEELDSLTERIEQRCYEATERHKTVARDLRVIFSALQISSSLERMGDLAEHVARQAQMRYPRSAIPEDLRDTFAQLGELAQAMVTRTATLLSERNLALADEIFADDDKVDALHRQLFTSVLSPTWDHGVEAAIDATLLSRYYERFADHAVTIARRVVQIVTGDPYPSTEAASHHPTGP